MPSLRRPSAFTFDALPAWQKSLLVPTVVAAVFFVPAILTEGLPQNQVWRSTLVEFGYFAVAALGLNILVGYCGLLNLGFAGFMCIGAYTAAILMKTGVYIPWLTDEVTSGTIVYHHLLQGGQAVHVMLGETHGVAARVMEVTSPVQVYYYFHASYWQACILATLHGALWGVILGLPTLHLTGDYFAIVTFGFAELVILAARNNIFGLTGGTRGFPDVPGASVNMAWLQYLGFFRDLDPALLRLETSVTEKIYDWYVVAFWLVLVVFFFQRLTRSRVGRAWRAIREDELAAQACGINTRWIKTQAFMISAGLGALAGAMQAAALRNVDWANFKFITSVYVLCYVVLGGMGTIAGTLLGTFLLVGSLEGLRYFLKEILPGMNPTIASWGFLEDMRLLMYGIVLVVFIRFRPEGLVSSRRIAHELHPDTERDTYREDVGYDDIRTERRPPIA